MNRSSSASFGGLLGAGLAAMALAWSPIPAAAQSEVSPPKPYELTDANFVDLTSLSLNVTTTTISIGQLGQGGLSYSATYVGGGADTWRHSTYGGLYRRQTPSQPTNQPYQWYEVSVPGTSAYFRDDGFGTLELVPGSGSGALVITSPTIMTYTGRDGSIYTFDRSQQSYTPYRSNQGLLTQIQRPDGEVVDYTYTSGAGNNRIQSITNTLGYQLHFDYASDTSGGFGWNRVTRVTAFNMGVDACAPTAFTCSFSRTWPSLTFASAGSERSATDALSRTLRVINSGGLVTGVARPTTSSGQNLTYTWTPQNTLASASDGVGTWSYVRTNPFDPSGNYDTVTTVTDPLAHPTEYTVQWIDPFGDGAIQPNRVATLLNIRNALNQDTAVVQNAEGLQSVTYPEGNGVSVAYNNGNPAGITRTPKPGSGLSSTSVIATFGDCSTPIRCAHPTAITDERGNTSNFTYNAFGQVTAATAPAPTVGAVRPETRYTYQSLYAWYRNAAGTIVQAPMPVSRVTGTSACAISATCAGAAQEVVTATTYEAGSGSAYSNLSPIEISSGAGDGSLSATTVVTYDPNGDVSTTQSPLGASDVTRNIYDAMRQQVGVIGPDPDGGGSRAYPATRTTYNADGQVTATERGTTTGQIDLDWASFTPLQTSTAAYNFQGRKERDVAFAGSADAMVTQYTYDAAGRLSCSAQRMNPATFGGLPSSACTAATAGGFGPDRIAFNEYDVVDRLTRTTDGYTTAEARFVLTQAYTLNGKVDWVEDAQGNRSEYTYDGLDRVSHLFFPITTVGAHAANPGDYEAYGYDANDNPTIKLTRSGGTFTTTFDALNRAIFIDAPSGSNDVAYAYDNLNRRLSATHPGGQVVSATWDALGRQRTETGALGTVTMAYDLKGRLTRQDWPGAAFYTLYNWNWDDQIYSILVNRFTTAATYTYDNLGRRTLLTRGNSTATAYAYDGASRLTTLVHDLAGTANDQGYGFTFNPASQATARNATNSGYSFAPANNANTYANNGLNQATTAGALALSWDTRGNLTQIGAVTQTYDSANRLITNGGGVLSYDPLDRLSQYTGTQGAVYGYAGSSEIAYLANDGVNINNRFVRGPWSDEIVVSYAGTGTLTPVWWIQDQQASTIAITDGSGAVAGINRYDEYGRPASGNTARFQYTGQLWLPDFGVYHYKARAYHPGLGRFMQTDPVGYNAGLNLYAYVGDDPVNQTDPSGLSAAQEDETTVDDVIVTGRRRNTAPFVCLFCAAQRFLERHPASTWPTIPDPLDLLANPCAGAEERFGRPVVCGVVPLDMMSGPGWRLGSAKSAVKWANRLARGGWTADAITRAINSGARHRAINMVNPGNGATRYVHPETGASVVRDDVTGEILHVGRPGMQYDR